MCRSCFKIEESKHLKKSKILDAADLLNVNCNPTLPIGIKPHTKLQKLKPLSSPSTSPQLKDAGLCQNCRKPLTGVFDSIFTDENDVINNKNVVRCCGKFYHSNCFTCNYCKNNLSANGFTVDAYAKLACLECFHQIYAPKCFRCKKPIKRPKEKKGCVKRLNRKTKS